MSRRRKRRRTLRRSGRSAKPKKLVNSWLPLVFLALGLMGIVGVYWWQAAITQVQDGAVRLSTVGEALCPVGGMPIKQDVLIQTPDGPIYFCCKHCIERYNAEPSAFQNAVDAQRRSMSGDTQPAD